MTIQSVNHRKRLRDKTTLLRKELNKILGLIGILNQDLDLKQTYETYESLFSASFLIKTKLDVNKNKIFSFNLGLILSDKCLELSIMPKS